MNTLRVSKVENLPDGRKPVPVLTTNAIMTSLQTRIPSFLWNALQDTFYEQDVAFLRALAPHIQVPLPELKRTLLGARGQLTTIQVSAADAWWETELCPLRCRDTAGVWRQCGCRREASGFCRKHRDFWCPSDDLKHKDDPWFQNVVKRMPCRFEGHIVWVAPDGSVIRQDGTPFEGLHINLETGMADLTPLPCT